MKLLIAVHHFFDQWNVPAWFAERLRHDFPNLNIVHLPDYQRLDAEIPDAEILLAWTIRPEQIKAARKLRWIHSPAAAVHTLIIPEVVDSDIQITNAREVHGPVVAEHVIALIFALAKKIPGSVTLQQKHVWGQQILWDETPRVREVSGATLGLIGLGAIGRAVVAKAKALGMRVIAVREHPEKGSDGADAVFGPARINDVFSQADYVVLAAPFTDSTKAIANAARLALMKPGACLINVARGALVDEAALAAALRGSGPGLKPGRLLQNPRIGQSREGHEFHSCHESGQVTGGFQPLREVRAAETLFQQPASPQENHVQENNVEENTVQEKKIGGAALDVFPKEPLPADSPLWDLPNLLITPHTAALTDKLWERHYTLFSENLRRYLASQPLLGVVDKKKGY